MSETEVHDTKTSLLPVHHKAVGNVFCDVSRFRIQSEVETANSTRWGTVALVTAIGDGHLYSEEF